MYLIQSKRTNKFLTTIGKWGAEHDANVLAVDSHQEATKLAKQKRARVVIQTEIECPKCHSSDGQSAKRSQYAWPRKTVEKWGMVCRKCGHMWGFPWHKK